MTPDQITAFFTRSDGSFLCARWGRPIVPVIFGVTDETLAVLKGGIEAVVALAGHKMAETDPEVGANLMVFFCRDWDEILGVPNLGQLVDGLPELVVRLKGAGATRYRTFRFDAEGAVRLCVTFVRVDNALAAEPVEAVALDLATQAMLTWSDAAFAKRSPLALANGNPVLSPDVAALVAAAYDPLLPSTSQDPSHGLRLFARMPR